MPASSSQILLGDVNGDGHVNNTDITDMMTALTDINAYKSAHPSFDNSIGDVNADGAFNNKDIQGLITYLQTGHGSTSAVPEPASLVLLGLAAPALSWAGFRRRRSPDSLSANSIIRAQSRVRDRSARRRIHGSICET